MFDWTILTRPRHDCQFNGLTRLNLFALVAARLMTLCVYTRTPHASHHCIHPAYRPPHFSLYLATLFGVIAFSHHNAAQSRQTTNVYDHILVVSPLKAKMANATVVYPLS